MRISVSYRAFAHASPGHQLIVGDISARYDQVYSLRGY